MKALLTRRGRPQPTPADLAYRRTTNRLGATLVLFLILFDVLGQLFDPVVQLAEYYLDENAAYAVEDLCNSLDYLLSFMLPGILFYLITPRRERVPMMLSPTFPKGSAALILIGMMVISSSAIINSWMVSIVGYGSFSSEVLWENSTLQDYEGVLLFISTAIVPAFCEEFLFRGIICNNLRPYGKTVAVLGSALLFGLMHQNIGQLFYTTMAGIVLALIYLETKSIWTSVLLHLFNNLTSVVYDIVIDRLDLTSSNRIMALMDAVIFGVGLIALLWLVIKGERARARGEKGVGVLSGVWNEDTVERQMPSAAYRVRYFLSPLMLTFVICVIGQMLWLLTFAIRYVYG
ncbi:MAG: CPBP family intramembrane metalloprotease [Clostridia bacterium]|nr:CPBP family intramembrane metalloprotease [Clostridia bacterium]